MYVYDYDNLCAMVVNQDVKDLRSLTLDDSRVLHRRERTIVPLRDASPPVVVIHRRWAFCQSYKKRFFGQISFSPHSQADECGLNEEEFSNGVGRGKGREEGSSCPRSDPRTVRLLFQPLLERQPRREHNRPELASLVLSRVLFAQRACTYASVMRACVRIGSRPRTRRAVVVVRARGAAVFLASPREECF